MTEMNIELLEHTPCAPSYAHPDDPTREDTP